MINIYKKFGKRFKELREANNLTQEQLAEYLGIEARQISRIETGKCFTTLGNLERISKLYNINLEDIFKFEHFKSKQDVIDSINVLLSTADEKSCRVLYKIAKDIIF